MLKNNFLDYLIFFISGFMEAVGTVVPGISSTAILMIIGTYNIIISLIGNITNYSLILSISKVLIPFTLGLIIGIIIMIKAIDILFKKYKSRVYSFILGILLSNVILLIIRTFKDKVNIIELIIGCLFLFLGILISNIMEER